VGAVTRLRDMGVEPFLLSSSLIGVLAQRLVRLLCPQCKKPYVPPAADCQRFGFSVENPPTVYTSDGCSACNHSGYSGRTGIYELLEVDEKLRSMIHDGAGEQELEAYAHARYRSLFLDGMRRVLAGHTSLEEVLRVTHEG
jgi:general secretion pathway protein E